MPVVSTPDFEVEYFTAGSGPGLVLVHGTGGSAETNFGHLVDAFTDVRTVVRPNLSGSGATKDAGGPLTVDLLVEQLVATVRETGTGPTDAVGYSLGAVVVAAAAARHPELFRRVALVGGWAHTDARLHLTFDVWRRLNEADHPAFIRFLHLTGWTNTQLNHFGREGLAPYLEAPIPPGMGRQIELDLTVDIRALLPTITTPTLVIGFTDDQMVPVEHSRALHASIADSVYEELDAGHLGIFERAEELTGALRGFLES
ncbi:alpha/beta hydrolase [Streptomyces crystallinus]|uniref:Alpha/beta fold hydrolase n=1 Tax=Streptomyces crystallinus TaxID=68191 RepID=A0ABP3RU34_9ACTN